MARSMRYSDRRGDRRTLTFPQYTILSTASLHTFDQGWGGLDSTISVRIMDDCGLIVLRYVPGQPWRVTGITTLGREVLAAWRARDEPGGT